MTRVELDNVAMRATLDWCAIVWAQLDLVVSWYGVAGIERGRWWGRMTGTHPGAA